MLNCMLGFIIQSRECVNSRCLHCNPNTHARRAREPANAKTRQLLHPEHVCTARRACRGHFCADTVLHATMQPLAAHFKSMWEHQVATSGRFAPNAYCSLPYRKQAVNYSMDTPPDTSAPHSQAVPHPMGALPLLF